MKNLKSKTFYGVALALLGITTLSASAAPVKDNTGALFVDGLTPSSRVIIEYKNASKTISVNADPCGLVRIRNSSSTPLANVTDIKIDGMAKTVPTVIDTVPRCLNGVLEVSLTTPIRTPSGDLVFPGFGALSQHQVQFPGIALSRQLSVNACGFTRITNSDQYPLSGILTVAGTNIDTATVAMDDPPLCRNNVLYKAQ